MGLGAAAAAAKKKAQRRFKLRGFTLKVDALDEALEFVSRFPEAEDEALDLLIDEIDKESRTDPITLFYLSESHFLLSFCCKKTFFVGKMAVKSSILDRDAIRRVVSLLLEAESAVEPTASVASSRTALRVIDVFLVPRFRYDSIKRVFYEYAPRFSWFY